MSLSVANGDNGFPFCKIVSGSYVNPDDCGARERRTNANVRL